MFKSWILNPIVLMSLFVALIVGCFCSSFGLLNLKPPPQEPLAHVSETPNTESQPQEAASEIPETLEIVYQKDGQGSIHYILRDNETGYEYIVVVRTAGAGGISTSITPRLGINGHNPQPSTT